MKFIQLFKRLFWQNHGVSLHYFINYSWHVLITITKFVVGFGWINFLAMGNRCYLWKSPHDRKSVARSYRAYSPRITYALIIYAHLIHCNPIGGGKGARRSRWPQIHGGRRTNVCLPVILNNSVAPFRTNKVLVVILIS